MRTDASWRRWSGWLLALALASTSCASVKQHAVGATLGYAPGTAGPGSAESASPSVGPEPRPPQRLYLRKPQRERLLGRGSEQYSREETGDEGLTVPDGWPDYEASELELLAPFLACSSPARFLELQRRVDMPRLLETVSPWSAVRLSALGPMASTEAAEVLLRKRTALLREDTERYGPAHAEVFALFLLHSAFDDEVEPLLRHLAEDKQLSQTLGLMPSVLQHLAQRGLALERFAQRGEQTKDVLRGLGRAARDALATSEVQRESRWSALFARRAHLPPAYQLALDGVERERMRQHFAPGHAALGSFDAMTFGVPLGFYHLVAGTAQGAGTLAQGHYEQATRELSPAALLVVLYAGGRSVRAATPGSGGSTWAQAAQLRWQGLRQMEQRLREHLGAEGFEALARYLQSRRELGLLVAESGEPAALAVFAARGDGLKARARLSQAQAEGGGRTPGNTGKGLGPTASLADEAVGVPLEVAEARLRLAELEAPGPRLSANVALLEQQRPRVEAPPPGVPEGAPRWAEYVAYREQRLGELRQGQATKGPLRWESYEALRGWFAQGMAFERSMVAKLREDAALPRAQRRWLGDFEEPRIETHVGVAKQGVTGVRFVDVLVIEQRPLPGRPARVESFSFKSRDLSLLKEQPLAARMIEDARAARDYYGGRLDIRRPALKQLGPQVQVRRVRLVYEGGRLKPEPDVLRSAEPEVRSAVKEVEVLFQ
ncbi:MAG TPA: hypothetical protein VK539_33610 [Myxococcaceae bacterium]|nr:hypothetical protein [Myxococcaceae bacterium]